MSLPFKKSSGNDNLSQLGVKIFWEQIVLLLAVSINKSIVAVGVTLRLHYF